MQINPVKNRISNEQTAQQAQKLQRAEEVRQPLQEKPVEQAAKGEFYQEPDQYSPKDAEPPAAFTGRSRGRMDRRSNSPTRKRQMKSRLPSPP